MNSTEILDVLDGCCAAFTFPMLDNGYVYLAATRLALFRSEHDWAMTIEVFGFSPRAGVPDTHVHTFGSRLLREKSAADYATPQSWDNYLANNPNNESRFFFPLDEGDWQDEDDAERMSATAQNIPLRGQSLTAPSVADLAAHDIKCDGPGSIRVHELCRWLAATQRDLVLATAHERRASVPAELAQILQLEAWHHPDVVNGELPSGNADFRALADVLVRGDVGLYTPHASPNTDWRNWPGGGQL